MKDQIIKKKMEFEKIITWKKAPEYYNFLIFLVCFLILYLNLLGYIIEGTTFGDGIITVIFFVGLVFISTVMISCSGEGKKIIYRRIK